MSSSGAPTSNGPGSAHRAVLRTPSRWIGVLDAITAVILGVGVSVAAFGGIRLPLGPVKISVTSVWKLTAALVVLVAVRHVILPAPPFPATLRTRAAASIAWFRSASARSVMSVWLATRFGVIATAFLGASAIGMPPGVPADVTGLRGVENPLVNLVYRWDTGWYLGIALDGYRWDADSRHRQQNVAFFPAYPILMRIGGAALGARPKPSLPYPASEYRLRARTLLAGWLVSLGAFLGALCVLHTWVARVSGARVAARTVLLLSTFPFAVYFSAAYTESLFLLAAVASFNALETQRARSACTWGLLAGLSRPNGFLIALPLLMIAFRTSSGRMRLSLAAMMPIVGMLMFSGYVWSLTGRPFAWAEAHAAWGRTLPTWNSAVTARVDLLAEQGVLGYASTAPLEIFNGAAVLCALALTPTIARRLGAPAAVFVLINLIPPLIAGGLMSAGRLTSTMFPVFAAMALVIPRRHVLPWAVFFTLLQGLAAVLFFTWRPLV